LIPQPVSIHNSGSSKPKSIDTPGEPRVVHHEDHFCDNTQIEAVPLNPSPDEKAITENFKVMLSSGVLPPEKENLLRESLLNREEDLQN